MTTRGFVQGLSLQPEWVTATAATAVLAGVAARALGAAGAAVGIAIVAGAAAALWLREQRPSGIVPPIVALPVPAKPVQDRTIATGAPVF